MPGTQQREKVYHFGPFVLDPGEHVLRREGQPVALTPKAFEALVILVRRQGKLLSKDELQRCLWPETCVEENNLTQYVSMLRKVLGENRSAGSKYIETVPRRGYRFVADVRECANGKVEARGAWQANRNVWLSALAVLVIGAALALTALTRNRGPVVVDSQHTKQHFTRPLTDMDTVVLADFDNRTGEPVFDDTLKQALAVQLQQSPFLSLVPDQQTRETLRFMGRSPDERLVGKVAQEVCKRQGTNAVVQGGITTLGVHYVIDLNATNCSTGTVLARAEIEVESKERVLAALGGLASQLRSRLGESLALVEKYDTPVLQATTPSLDALKAYTAGVIEEEKLNAGGALPFFKRAIEFDANFALAYVGEARAYGDTGEDELARASLGRAFELRDRVSEQEKLSITALYHDTVTGDSRQIFEANDLWATLYPREHLPHDNLASYYNTIGAFNKALEESSAAVRIAPHSSSGYVNLASAYFGLNRFQESRAALEPVIARGQGDFAMYCFLYVAAWAQNDPTAMQNYLAAAQKGLPEGEMTRLQFTRAEEAASYGKFRTAHEMNERSEQVASQLGLNQSAAAMAGLEALWQSQVGSRSIARQLARRTLTKARGVDVAVNAAVALAASGEIAGAQAVADSLARNHSRDTVLNAVSLPLIRSNIELARGNATQAVELLRSSQPYEMGFGFLYYPSFMPTYTRGQAYLRLRDGSNAAAEFHKVLDHRGLDPVSPIYALAHLQLGRANALAGDVKGARSAYQDFFALWKNADPDIPILKQAKAEYAKLE